MFFNVILRGSELMRMKSLSTEHVTLDRAACQACGKCVEACSRGVLALISAFDRHGHALVRRAELCTGCLKCVRVCPHGALFALQGSVT